ncbi:MAG: hypothetical protein RJA61_647 [Candidatus Parcubacteria bacterium]|jgi:hypothetical protein
MVSKKKTARKGILKHIFSKDIEKEIEAPEGKYFNRSNGQSLKTVTELISVLMTMPEVEFNHHTKEGRNDFANWLWFVFDEKDVADKIFKAKTKEETVKILEKHYS